MPSSPETRVHRQPHRQTVVGGGERLGKHRCVVEWTTAGYPPGVAEMGGSRSSAHASWIGGVSHSLSMQCRPFVVDQVRRTAPGGLALVRQNAKIGACANATVSPTVASGHLEFRQAYVGRSHSGR